MFKIEKMAVKCLYLSVFMIFLCLLLPVFVQLIVYGALNTNNK